MLRTIALTMPLLMLRSVGALGVLSTRLPARLPVQLHRARRCSSARAAAPAAAEAEAPALTEVSMDEIVNVCKRRGIIFQSSEVYGGFAGFFDYGPLGVELRANIKKAWWRDMVHRREDVVGLDSSIIASPQVWKASGHVAGFSDPMVDCKSSKLRYRADQVPTPLHAVRSTPSEPRPHLRPPRLPTHTRAPSSMDPCRTRLPPPHPTPHPTPPTHTDTHARTRARTHTHTQTRHTPHVHVSVPPVRTRAQLFWARAEVEGELLGYVSVMEADDMQEQAEAAAQKMKRKAKLQGTLTVSDVKDYTEASAEEQALIPSPATGEPGTLTAPRDFNLMFQTSVGAMSDASSVAYLRPETAQGIFTNFKNVLATGRVKVPFGIAQIGKAFRNEITPRNFIFRSREFEQMEIEYFITPEDETWPVAHQKWLDTSYEWLLSIGLRPELLSFDVHPDHKLAHYARACTDIMFKFPFGTQELQGVAARGCFDLTSHAEASGKSMEYYDDERKEKYVPHVIEPSIGVDRLMLAVLTSAYAEDEVGGEKRSLLKVRLPPPLLPPPSLLLPCPSLSLPALPLPAPPSSSSPPLSPSLPLPLSLLPPPPCSPSPSSTPPPSPRNVSRAGPGCAVPPPRRANQGGRAAARQEQARAHGESARDLREAAAALQRAVRLDRCHRPSLPSDGRGGDAVLRHGGL